MVADRMAGYCLDTNVISDILRGNELVIQRMNEALDNGCALFISSVVYYEIVRGLKASGAFKRLEEFYETYNDFTPLFLDRDGMEVIEKAADIYAELHRGQQIEDNDVYIAAIAMVNDCTLVTANKKHFERIDGLRIANWRE